MKKIYKIGLSIFLLMQGLNISAQGSHFSFGAEIGGNLSNTTYDLFEASRSPKPGFNIGATVEYEIQNGLYLQSGLALTTKGAKHKSFGSWSGSNQIITHLTRTINQIYIQLPVMAGYKVEVTPETNVFIKAGPYIAYGIGGKNKLNTEVKGGERSNKTETESTFGSKQLKRFDFGVGGGIGLEFRQFVIGLNYELGLRNISYEDDNLTEIFDYKNRNAILTLGYKFY